MARQSKGSNEGEPVMMTKEFEFTVEEARTLAWRTLRLDTVLLGAGVYWIARHYIEPPVEGQPARIEVTAEPAQPERVWAAAEAAARGEGL